MNNLKITYLALVSIKALKRPGNTKELLTWLGKSDLPVATIKAPASYASALWINLEKYTEIFQEWDSLMQILLDLFS